MVQRRGEKVIEAVLKAATDELSTRGYPLFSVEAVAERAGVNKTTVYRRWPTKDDLVRAALGSEGEKLFADPDTGNLEDDLLVIARRLSSLMATPRGRALHAMLVLADEQEILPVEDRRNAQAIFTRALERGELPRSTDIDLLAGAFFSTVMLGPVLGRGERSVGQHRKLVAMLLAGNAATAAQAPQRRRTKKKQL